MKEFEEGEKANVVDLSTKFKTNYSHLTVFMLAMCLSGITVGYGKDVANQLSDTFDAKYNWVSK